MAKPESSHASYDELCRLLLEDQESKSSIIEYEGKTKIIVLNAST